MRVLAGISSTYGEDLILDHWRENNPTFVLFVGDWGNLRELPKLASEEQLQLVFWVPFDYLSLPDPTVKATLRMAWKVVPWTEYAYKKLTEPPHSLGNVARPIPLGVEPALWDRPEIRREDFPKVMKSVGFSTAPNAFNILCVGANQHRKYLAQQIHAVGLLQAAHPELDVHLYLHTMAGGEVDVSGALEGAGLNGHFTMPNPYMMSQGGISEAQMATIYGCSDVVLNVCLEGMGLSMLQAQCMGVPTIGLLEGPAPEIIQYGVAVPSTEIDLTTAAAPKPLPSPGAIAAALESLIDYRGKRASRDVIDGIIAKYSWDTVAQQWFDLIENVLLPEQERFSMQIPTTQGPLLRKRARQVVEW